MLGHKTSFWVLPLIGFIEFFERFGFYTLQGIMVLYFLKVHHFSQETAYHVFGAFSALLYGFVGIGGYCGDKIFGPKKTLLLGLLVMFLGYLSLTFFAKQALFPSLAAVCLGNALFKANPGAILGHLYQNQPDKLHSAFTIFYMTVNMGALLALIIGPFLSSHYDYSYAFAASAFGIFIAIIAVLFQHHRLNIALVDEAYPSLGLRGLLMGGGLLFVFWALIAFLLSSYEWVIIGLKIVIMVVLFTYFLACQKEQGLVRRKMYAVLILMVEAVIFFTLYQQMPTSINIYAIMHVHPQIFGQTFDPQSFQALNPFWIILWSPILAKFYQKNAISQHPWSIFRKFAIGMLCCALSYVILFISQYFHDANFQVSALWLVSSYIFQSLAELFVSGLGLAMVAELVPDYRMGGVMGMWFLTSAVSGFTGAKVASYTVAPSGIVNASMESLHNFCNVFGQIAWVVLFMAMLMIVSAKYFERMIRVKS